MVLSDQQSAAVGQILDLFKGDKGDPGQSIKGDKGDPGPKGDKGDPGPASPDGKLTFLNFGGSATGSNDKALENMRNNGIQDLWLPPGVWHFDGPFDTTGFVRIAGLSMGSSIIAAHSTTDDGMIIKDASDPLRLEDFQLRFVGGPQVAGKHGARVMRAVHANRFYVRGFTGTGIYADTADGTANGAPFFSRWDNVWSKRNGGDGMAIRSGANGWSLDNCQLDNNKGGGLHHFTDGFATYNTTIRGGQCCYNTQPGWWLESGTSINATNIYSEYNGTPTNTNKDGYTSQPFDYVISAKCNNSKIEIGAVLNNKLQYISAPTKGLNDSVGVFLGARRIFGSTAYTLLVP